MRHKKYIWTARAIFFNFFYLRIKFPSYIGKPIYILGKKNIIIKEKVRIFPGLRIEAHDTGKIIIERNVGIAQNVHLTCSESEMIISEGTLVLANTFITNIDHDYSDKNLPVLNQKMIVTRTFIGKNCLIGAGSAILAGTLLGDHCIVASNSVVRGSFPSNCVIGGNPARILKYI